jgi:hypothetical protein
MAGPGDAAGACVGGGPAVVVDNRQLAQVAAGVVFHEAFNGALCGKTLFEEDKAVNAQVGVNE